MRRSRRLHGFTFALLVGSGACSLRSLDYLENGEASAGAAAITSGTTSKETGGSGGDLGGRAGAGGKAGAGGTNGGNAGSSSNGGTGTAGSTSGAGGTAGSTGGGSGGTVDPAGGNDAGGSDAGGADTGGAGSDGGGAGEAGAPSCTPGDSGCPPTVAPEVPYVLRPGHALSKCADVDGFSVVNGGSVIQYSCYNQSNQVFWAEDHGEGRLAFRNALSGKCLSVEGASVAPDARVEQRSCTGSENQLFLPVATDSDLVKLVAQHSELLLDVAGDAPTENVRLLVQNPDDGSPDMTWQLELAEVGGFVTLAANEQRELRLRHDGEDVLLEESAEGSVEWKIVSGLGDPECVSFASRDDPDHYLRQSALTLYREQNDGSAGFARDSTFCFRNPLEGSGYTAFSLESASQAGYYVTRSEGAVVLEESDGSVEFRTAATWHFGQLRP